MKKFSIMNYLIIFAIIVFGGMGMGISKTKNIDIGWKTTNSTYKGFPIYLRYKQAEKNVETSSLVQVTLPFEKVKDNGLPETIYNNSLFGIDTLLVECAENDDGSAPILIETFAGKRKFYFFTNRKKELKEKIQKIINANLNLNLEMKIFKASNKIFITGYFDDIFNDK